MPSVTWEVVVYRIKYTEKLLNNIFSLIDLPIHVVSRANQNRLNLTWISLKVYFVLYVLRLKWSYIAYPLRRIEKQCKNSQSDDDIHIILNCVATVTSIQNI